MAGELSRRDRARVARLVAQAEEATGLQVVVYVGPADGDPAARADELLARAGATGAPSVLLLVALAERRVEVRTDPSARARVPDDAAATVVAALTERLAEGDLVGGVRAALQVVRDSAGPGTQSGAELPDVLGP